MMRIRVYLGFLILGFGIFVASVVVTQAVSKPGIKFPVQELGGCKNQAECKTYCENQKNMNVCLDFAEKHNLMSKKEIEGARKFVKAGAKGPGNCTSKESCERYCNDISRIDECLSYAEQNDLMSSDELAEARKVRVAIKNGVKLPGGCKNKEACDDYCNDLNHMEECIVFAESVGFIPENELGEARKALQAIKKGVKPPPCRGKEDCDKYCSEPQNLEQCLAFAEAAGFISRGEASMARKTGGKGPGNCRGEAECKAFCENPKNEETCFNFGKEHGLISVEDLEEMEMGLEQTRDALDGASDEVMECVSGKVGKNTIRRIQAGESVFLGRNFGDAMRMCFEQEIKTEEDNYSEDSGSDNGEFSEAQDFESQDFEESDGFAPEDETGGNLLQTAKKFFLKLLGR